MYRMKNVVLKIKIRTCAAEKSRAESELRGIVLHKNYTAYKFQPFFMIRADAPCMPEAICQGRDPSQKRPPGHSLSSVKG